MSSLPQPLEVGVTAFNFQVRKQTPRGDLPYPQPGHSFVVSLTSHKGRKIIGILAPE